jgi:hypothetical protein
MLIAVIICHFFLLFHQECGAVPEIDNGVVIVKEADAFANVVCSLGFTAAKNLIRCLKRSGKWEDAECQKTGV